MNDETGQDKSEKPAPAKTGGREHPVTRSFAREFGEIATAGQSVGQGWWQGVKAWFVFIHNRRPDTRYPIFPKPLRIAEILAIAASIIALLVLIADPFMLAAIRAPGWQPHPVFNTITRFGESAWVLYPAGAALIAFSLLRDAASRKKRLDRHSVMLAVYYLFTTIAFAGLLANLFKNLIGRARPPFVPQDLIWQSIPFGDNYEYASFPSGHATTAGGLAVALALLFPRLRVFLVLAGMWIAVSRPALAVHFPSDVVAGFAFGAAFAYYYARSFARKRLLFVFGEAGRLKLRTRHARFLPRFLRGEAE